MFSLKELRTKNGITQEELAEAFGITTRTIQNLEKDSSNIRDSILSKYMRAFNVNYDEIFLGTKYEIFERQTKNKEKILKKFDKKNLKLTKNKG